MSARDDYPLLEFVGSYALADKALDEIDALRAERDALRAELDAHEYSQAVQWFSGPPSPVEGDQ
jgi:hypothetical protein